GADACQAQRARSIPDRLPAVRQGRVRPDLAGVPGAGGAEVRARGRFDVGTESWVPSLAGIREYRLKTGHRPPCSSPLPLSGIEPLGSLPNIQSRGVTPSTTISPASCKHGAAHELGANELDDLMA